MIYLDQKTREELENGEFPRNIEELSYALLVHTRDIHTTQGIADGLNLLRTYIDSNPLAPIDTLTIEGLLKTLTRESFNRNWNNQALHHIKDWFTDTHTEKMINTLREKNGEICQSPTQ